MKPVEVVRRGEDWTKEELDAMERMFKKQKENKDYIRFNNTNNALKYLRKI